MDDLVNNLNATIMNLEHCRIEDKVRIAGKLKFDYEQFKEAKELAMTTELGDVLLVMLENIFKTLKSEGVDCENY